MFPGEFTWSDRRLKVDARRVWTAALPAMFLPGLASLFYFVILGEQPLAKLVFVSAKGFMLLWPLLAWRFLLKRPLGNPAGGLVFSRTSVLWGVGSGLLISAVMLLLMQTRVGVLVADHGQDIRRKVEDLGLLDHFILVAVVLSVFHSLFEEYYWRWFVFGQMRCVLSQGTAHGVAGVAFSLHHIVVLSQYFPMGWAVCFGLAAGMGGGIWSLMYQFQKTLAGAWISHVLIDATLMGIGYWAMQSRP